MGYRIIRRISSGGMGTAYEAEQENPRRPVALKVINAGLVSQNLLRRRILWPTLYLCRVPCTLVWACWDNESGSTLPANMATLKPARNTGVSPSVAMPPSTPPPNMATPYRLDDECRVLNRGSVTESAGYWKPEFRGGRGSCRTVCVS